MARRRQRRTGLFQEGYGFSVTHGQTVIPAKTYSAGLKKAVAEARSYNTVTHLVARDKKRHKTFRVLAVCIPRFKDVDELRRVRRPRIVDCHLKVPVKKRKR